LSQLRGFIAGANAIRAGFAYDVFHSVAAGGVTTSSTITGAVALKR
jgi:hypothetical protein